MATGLTRAHPSLPANDNVVVPRELFPVAHVTPELDLYDVILVNSSAGKDSQAMLDLLAGPAGADRRARMVVVHCDLGRVEWPGTRDLAGEHAAHYGLRFEVVRREKGDLLDQLVNERRMWPDSARRWCTSDQKTAQVRKLITRLAAEVRARPGWDPDRTPRILNCLGMRAQESPKRRRMVAFEHDPKASSGRRHVDRWLPIHDWTVDQVWARCHEAGTRIHYAYLPPHNMPRLSCCMCVLASRAAVVSGARANPELADLYVEAEVTIGHSFRQHESIADIVAEARSTDPGPATIEDWAA